MNETQRRKEDHLEVSLGRDTSFRQTTTGLERYRFIHCALPDLDLASLDLSTRFLNRRLELPFLLSCMTGGTGRAGSINKVLAAAAEQRGVAMGLGSCRVLLEEPSALPSFQVRDAAPNVFLLANLGAVQLNRGVGIDDVRGIVDSTGADALVLHLNPLQEVVQGGDTDFRGLLPRIEALCGAAGFPVIAKEVGNGLSAEVARSLTEAGVAALDVAGAGGTSWARIEGMRVEDPALARLGETMAEWGIPTADSLVAVRKALPTQPLIASGGLRTGLDAAKCIALGADLAGFAQPLLAHADDSVDAVLAALDQLALELRTAMFCVNAGTISALKAAPLDGVS